MARKNYRKNQTIEELRKIAENTKPQKEKAYVRIGTIAALIVACMTITGLPSLKQAVQNHYQQKAEAYNNIGLELYNQGKYEEAIEYYNKAVELEKHNIEEMDICYYNRGRAYYGIGMYEQAIQDYTSALNINERSKYYSSRSKTYEKIGDMESAYSDTLMSLTSN